ncbi:MAG: alpha-N-acetylglucosaminidase C-terminal domain-containing protein, partial [Opitutales bacterium]|nr:alpha-N-acetylglucosaminidase C-terminal domain-containing protein [Opitutales bacterium]
SAGKKDHSLALDLYADKHPFWQNCNGYDGTPWLWCLLQNFGGNTGMEGDLQGLCNGLKRALTAPNRGKLVGVGIVPEGSFNNPVIFELLSDIAVRGNVPENIDEWLSGYQTSRYGRTTPQLEQAWKILLKTAYSYTAKEGPLNSALPARPRFGNFIKARFWASNMTLPYNNAELLKALQLFDSQKNLFAKKATFRYDYAELQRQVIDNLSHAVYARLNSAWNAKDKAAYADAAKDFLRLFELCDARFSQFPKYKNDARNFSQSLEKWLSDAQKLGAKKNEKAYLRNCAQTHLTTWVEKAGTNLDDYAFREWIGLNDAYYAKRWEMFFDETKKALAAGTAFDQNAFDQKLNAFEDKWSANPKHKVKIAGGNTTAEIAKLVKKYAGTNLSGGARPDDSPLGVQDR